MDRGAWRVTDHEVTEELDTAEHNKATVTTRNLKMQLYLEMASLQM